MGKWISVKDKLPDEGQRVLHYFEHVGIHAGKYRSYTDEQGFTWEQFYSPAGFLSNDVTHWMPLPEPPKDK